MYNKYTGRRQTWEQKFVYYNQLFKTEEILGSNPNELYNRIVQKDFSDVIETEFDGYKLPLDQNDTFNTQVDNKLLNYNLIKEIPFNNNNPYKFISNIVLQIDTITFQTFNMYDPKDNPDEGNNADRYKELQYTNLTEMLPITVTINNKQVEFTAGDGITEFKLNETYIDLLTNKPVLSVPPIPGNIYIESYEKQFELSSIPQKIEVQLDINNNAVSQYFKTPFFRSKEYAINNDERIDKALYEYAQLMSIRIDGRIISTIDYDALDIQNLTRPKRTVPEKITLNNLQKILNDALNPDKEDKEEDKDKKKKKKTKKILNIVKSMTPEEAKEIVDALFKRDKPDEPTNIIEEIKEDAQENILQ